MRVVSVHEVAKGRKDGAIGLGRDARRKRREEGGRDRCLGRITRV